MQFNEDKEKAAELLKEAIPLMVARNIPTNPHNYALWYAHVKNVDQELSGKLQANFKSAGSYDARMSENLFYEYFVKIYLSDNEEAQKSLAKLLSSLFGTIATAAEGTSHYSDSVKEAMDEVQGTTDPGKILTILSNLAEDTNEIEKLTNSFKNELTLAKNKVESLQEELKNTEKATLIDELTAVGNRRYFNNAMKSSLLDKQTISTLILLDIDHFKLCNDNYGHVIGDYILQLLGEILLDFEKPGIQVARCGGDEFAIVFEGDSEQAVELAEAIRKKVESIRIKRKNDSAVIDNIAVSMGIAEATAEDTVDSLLERSDKALYRAKEGGRNRIMVEEPEVSQPA